MVIQILSPSSRIRNRHAVFKIFVAFNYLINEELKHSYTPRSKNPVAFLLMEHTPVLRALVFTL